MPVMDAVPSRGVAIRPSEARAVKKSSVRAELFG